MKVFYRGLRLVYSSGFNIDPELWDTEKGRAKTNKRAKTDIYRLNKELDKIAQTVIDIYVEFDYGDIPRKDYKLELAYRLGHKERPRDNEKTLFSFIPAFIEDAKEKHNVSRATWQKYESIYNHLQQYAKDKKKDLDFNDIDWNFRNSFEKWLYDEPREFSQNNVAKIFSVLKQFLREAYRRGIHENTAFMDTGFGVKRAKTRNKVRFTFDELYKIFDHDFSEVPRLERVRDLFMIGAFTGLRFSDWYKASADNISKEKNGDQYLKVVTMKTKTPVIIYLGEEATAIMEKYAYSLPVISHQKFNDYIKEVVKIVLPNTTYQAIYSEGGVTKYETRYKWERASSHAARRSFATNYYETGKFAAADLMLITGHSTEKQFFEYIDVNPMQSARRFAKINKIMRNND
jgi:site-specific recombinase XerD